MVYISSFKEKEQMPWNDVFAGRSKGESLMEKQEQIHWLLDSRQMEIEYLKEIIRSLGNTKERLLDIITNPGNYDEQTVQRAWDHLKMIDLRLLGERDWVKIHNEMINVKRELKKIRKWCRQRKRDHGDGK